MPIATPAVVRKQIASGQPEALYLLQGDDDVDKSALAHEFEALVEEDLRPFNVSRLHAGDVTTGEKLETRVAELMSAARTLPMMAPRRLVLVFQADLLLMPKRESEAATRALDQLETLFQEPDAQTVIVLVAGSLDKRSRLYKLLAKQAVIVECGAVDGQADAERWVRTRVAAAKAEIDPAGARLLAERCRIVPGRDEKERIDVKRLRNDVDRLLLYALGQKRISVDDVRAIVGAAALQDEWAMTNAIETGDTATALRQLALMLESGAAPEKILGQLGWLVRTKFPTLAPTSLTGAVEALFRTDLGLKGSAGDPRVLLERLVVELCGTRGNGRASHGNPTFRSGPVPSGRSRPT